MTVRLGMVDLKDSVFIERKVKRAVENKNSTVDLVLLEMDQEVFFHQAVAPICLPIGIGSNLEGKAEFNIASSCFFFGGGGGVGKNFKKKFFKKKKKN